MFNKSVNSILNQVENSMIFSIVIINTLTSILLLTLPVAVQTLVNFIAFGHLIRPVATLSILVFILIVCSGALGIWNNILIEIIQQKLLVNVGYKLTRHFSHISEKALNEQCGLELVNRFFDIITVMKTLSGILLYGISIGLQMIFGLILLLLYHPLFIIFDLLILIALFFIVYIPYRIAKETAEEECIQKHAIAEWFDEIFLTRYLFRFRTYPQFVMEQADNHLVSYLKVRNRHFRQLIKHQVGFHGLTAFASALLLGLGGYLVIQNQLSLGQLVAAQIIMTSLFYALKQCSSVLEDYYDLHASTEKIDWVLSLDLEYKTPIPPEITAFIEQLDHVHLNWSMPTYAAAAPEKPLLIYSTNRDHIESTIKTLIGVEPAHSTHLTLNGLECTQPLLIALRQQSLLIQEPQWFGGNIYNNLVLNTPDISVDTLLSYLEIVSLTNKIMSLPQGLNTHVAHWKSLFTLSEVIRLMIVRALIAQPRLLIIEQTFDDLLIYDRDTVLSLISLLQSLKNTTLILTTHHVDFPGFSNRWILP